MHTVVLNIEDSVFDKVIYFLKNLPSNEVSIVEDNIVEDWSYLEAEIDKGMCSQVSPKTHEEVFAELREKYAH